jgi:hypothetical protein
MARSTFPKPMAARREKGVAKTQSLLGGQGTCRMYGFGVIGPDPQRSWLMVIGAAIGVAVILSLLLGALIVPGWIGIGILRLAFNNPRGVGVADEGVIVTRESLWNARPTSIVVLLPLESLFAQIGATKSHVRLQLGTEQVWLRRKELAILVAAARPTNPQEGSMTVRGVS